jgi:hypothetical protein
MIYDLRIQIGLERKCQQMRWLARTNFLLVYTLFKKLAKTKITSEKAWLIARKLIGNGQ